MVKGLVVNNSRKKLSQLTGLEKEQELARRRIQEEEKIERMGQESEEKAKPFVQEEVRQWEERERQFFEANIEILRQLAKKKKKEYFRHLAQIFLVFARDEDIPKRFGVQVDLTNRGIEVELIPTGYAGAIAFCGIPFYDIHAVKRLAIKLGNTVLKLQGYTHKTQAGVIIPDQEDMKIYGRPKS